MSDKSILSQPFGRISVSDVFDVFHLLIFHCWQVQINLLMPNMIVKFNFV